MSYFDTNLEKIKLPDEYVDNNFFNKQLDSGELGEIGLTYHHDNGNDETFDLGNFSLALFYGDIAQYRLLISQIKAEYKLRILRAESFPSNELVFDKLLNLIKRKSTVIPFVGAGFSVDAGCPSWSEYIVQQAVKAQLNKEAISERLKAGEHERVMEEVIAAQTENVFKRDFEASFRSARISPESSPATELNYLFTGSVITTNFDLVLEQSQKLPFEDKVIGTETSGRFLKAVHKGDRYLLKLHGNLDEPRYRVLRFAEYQAAYGEGEFDISLPIPKLLNKIFGSFTVLFMGCSLIADRYLKILQSHYSENSDFMPEHFAILNAPDDEGERIARDQFLASHGISPIWFEEGDWSAPAEILRLLKQEAFNIYDEQ